MTPRTIAYRPPLVDGAAAEIPQMIPSSSVILIETETGSYRILIGDDGEIITIADRES